MTGRATLILRRGGGYADRMRAYRILIDGADAGEVRRNDRVVLDVPAGPVTVQARIDWARSKPMQLTLGDGEEAEIEVSNTHGAILAVWAITFGMNNYLTLTRRS